jgi:hypothetical protein
MTSFPGQHQGMMLGKLGQSEGTDAAEACALLAVESGVSGALAADKTLFFRRLSLEAEPPESRAEKLKQGFCSRGLWLLEERARRGIVMEQSETTGGAE